jgi:hypothetical protein
VDLPSSGKDLTNGYAGFGFIFVFCRHFSSSSHRSRGTSASRSRQNGPEAEGAAEWRCIVEVT